MKCVRYVSEDGNFIDCNERVIYYVQLIGASGWSGLCSRHWNYDVSKGMHWTNPVLGTYRATKIEDCSILIPEVVL